MSSGFEKVILICILLWLLPFCRCFLVTRDLQSPQAGHKRDDEQAASRISEEDRRRLLRHCLSKREVYKDPPFHYTARLQRAMETKVAVMMEAGDVAFQNWSVNSYKDASEVFNKVLFPKCTLCKAAFSTTTHCMVTRMEILVPFMNSCADRTITGNHMRLKLSDGRTLLSTNGTIEMPHQTIAIFNLGDPHQLKNTLDTGGLDASIHAPPCIRPTVHQRALFEYCNIHDAVLDGLWRHDLTKAKAKDITDDVCDLLLKYEQDYDTSQEKMTNSALKTDFPDERKTTRKVPHRYQDNSTLGLRNLSKEIQFSDETKNKSMKKNKSENGIRRSKRSIKTAKQMHTIRNSGISCQEYQDVHKELQRHLNPNKDAPTKCHLLPFYVNLEFDIRPFGNDSFFPSYCVNVGICEGTCASYDFFEDVALHGTGYSVLMNRLASDNLRNLTDHLDIRFGCRPHKMMTIPIPIIPSHNDYHSQIQMIRDLKVHSCRCS